MKLKTTISFYFILSLFVAIPGCFEGTIEPVDPEGPIISNITRIISDQDWQTYVVEIDSTDFSIQFDSNVLDSYSLNEGDVIVSTVGYGLLRKIDAVNIEGGYLNITTSQATLIDVIEQGQASIRRTLTLSDVQKVEYLEPGVMLRPSIQNKEDIFTWDINAILYDHDGNPNTTNDQIRIEGEFEFYSDIIFEIDVRFIARLQRVQLGFETGNNAELQLIGEMEFEFEKKIPIATVTFHPIYLQMGVLPVVIVPRFVVEVGVKGGAEGKIIAGIEQSFMYEAGILYTRGANWTTYSDRTTLFDFQPPQASFKASARGFVQPQLEMMMYGVLGAYTNGSLYGEAIVEPFESPWWSLYTGFDLSAGAKAEIFSRELFDVDYTLFEWRHLLAQASTNISTPTVTTTAITEIDYTNASGGGEVTDDGGAPVTARGVAWSTSANPTIGDYKTEDGSGKGTFSSELTDLEPGTKYYVRAYATNNSGTGYGNQVSFTTQKDVQPPTVTTSNITNITETTARGGGNVTDDGGSDVSARGVVWKTSPLPTLEENIGYTQDGNGTGTFTSNITGLQPDTRYYVRAYAVNSAGTEYGSQVTFTTEKAINMPTVTTTSITNISKTSAQGGGSVLSDGGAFVSVRGVVWSTNQGPTIESNDGYTTDGSGVGSFISTISGLQVNTKYYVRAYATNSSGTAYGNQVEFTTDEGIDDVPPGVNEILGPEDIEKLKEKGLIIHKGLNPPNIEGNYYMDSLEDMQTGQNFMNYSYKFFDQTADLKIKLSHISADGRDVAEGEGAFISGTGDTFSTYIELVSDIDEGTHIVHMKLAQIISGKISANGIEYFQNGFIVTHKENDLDGNFLNVGDVRVIYEADGLAERVGSFPHTPAFAKDRTDSSLKKMLEK